MNPARFIRLWKRCAPQAAAAEGGEIFAEIKQQYAAAGRHYHTLAHIAHCLDWFDRVHETMQNPDAAEAALWFHDVVYDARGAGNEEKSAAWFAARAGQTSPVFAARVQKLIMDTAHCGPPDQADGDGCLVADIDLSSLGLPWPEFHRDSCNVRREYPHLDDATFARKQAKFLRFLLHREFLYGTQFFRGKLESQARQNIARHLSGLDQPEKMFAPLSAD